MGQTERGSYVLTILSPVPPELRPAQGTLLPVEPEDPYERLVTLTLMNALAALQRAGGTGFRPTLRYQGEDFATVLALVSAGLGIALVPRLATTKLPKRIATIPLADAPITRRIYTARLHSRRPATAAAFDDLLRS